MSKIELSSAAALFWTGGGGGGGGGGSGGLGQGPGPMRTSRSWRYAGGTYIASALVTACERVGHQTGERPSGTNHGKATVERCRMKSLHRWTFLRERKFAAV